MSARGCNSCGAAVPGERAPAWLVCDACAEFTYLRCGRCGTYQSFTLTPEDERCDCGGEYAVLTDPQAFGAQTTIDGREEPRTAPAAASERHEQPALFTAPQTIRGQLAIPHGY